MKLFRSKRTLALLAAAKVSGHAMDQEGDRDLVEDFLREAGDL